jgi:chemotaxis protein MotB
MAKLNQAATVGLVTLALAVGCGVKKETHKRVLDTLTATQSELDQTRSERDQLRDQNQALEGDLTAARGHLSKTEQEAANRIKELLGNYETAEQELLALRKQREQAEGRLAAFRKLHERLRALVDTGKLTVDFRNGQMTLKLPSEILFASGQGSLSKGGQAQLKEVLDILQEFKDRRFMVAGHTDNVPIRSRGFKNNWHLSTARAVSVLEFMLAAGFEGKNVAAAGFGEFDPVAPNDTDEGRQLNRRIEIILVPDLSELPNLTAVES